MNWKKGSGLNNKAFGMFQSLLVLTCNYTRALPSHFIYNCAKDLFRTFSFLRESREFGKAVKHTEGKAGNAFSIAKEVDIRIGIKPMQIKWFRLIQFLSILQTSLKQIVTKKKQRCAFTMCEIVLEH